MRKKSPWKHYVVLVGISLLLATLACNTPSGSSTPTPTLQQPMGASALPNNPAAATPEAATASAPTTTPSTTAPLAPSLTPTTRCDYDSVYVADVTIPDGTEVVAGASFTKTWRIQNNGCLPWPDGTVLLFVEGEQMGGPISVTVPATAVNGTQDISVTMIAPATAGEHTGYWRLRSADGIQFGDKIYVKINSVAPTPTITITPTIGLVMTVHIPGIILAFPDLYVSEFSLTPATPVAHSPVHARVGIYNKGSAAATAPFIVRWYGGEGFTNPSCEWTINSLVKNGGKILECDFTFASPYPSMNTKVVVDATSAIAETDETNNLFLQTITVSSP